MINIVIWGYSFEGVQLYKIIKKDSNYNFIGFADNDIKKQGCNVAGCPILSLNDMKKLLGEMSIEVIIAIKRWHQVGKQLEDAGIKIHGVFDGKRILEYKAMRWSMINFSERVDLYAGDIPTEVHLANPNLYGLSITKADERHILHDITEPYPIPDNSVDSYQAEDVLEHIEYEKLKDTVNEIYRVLKKGAVLRISLPDYNSPLLKEISMTDADNNIIFDANGGGKFINGNITDGGHVWFPKFDVVKELLKSTEFVNCEFKCYWDEKGNFIKNNFNYENGYVRRVPIDDSVPDEEHYSIVVDCKKVEISE